MLGWKEQRGWNEEEREIPSLSPSPSPPSLSLSPLFLLSSLSLSSFPLLKVLFPTGAHTRTRTGGWGLAGMRQYWLKADSVLCSKGSAVAGEGDLERLSTCARVRVPPGLQGEEVESLGSPSGGGSGNGGGEQGQGDRGAVQVSALPSRRAVHSRNLLAGRQDSRRPGLVVPPGDTEVQCQVLMDFPRSAAGL